MARCALRSQRTIPVRDPWTRRSDLSEPQCGGLCRGRSPTLRAAFARRAISPYFSFGRPVICDFVFVLFLCVCGRHLGAADDYARSKRQRGPARRQRTATLRQYGHRLHLRPLFTTTIRLPDCVTSLAVGAPTLFEVEHSDRGAKAGVRETQHASEAATSNLIIALQSGHEISMRLISDGEKEKRRWTSS